MPKLWSETIESHRHEVRDAILEATAALAESRGPFNVTMSEIAQTVGIGRATLYKYFPGVEEILDAWHERHIAQHLDQLRAKVATDLPPYDRLVTVLAVYARVIQRRSGHSGGNHSIELTGFLHRPDSAANAAAEEIHELVEQLILEAVSSGDVRTDTTAAELTHYCVHALEAAAHLGSNAATDRLIELILSGLRIGAMAFSQLRTEDPSG